MDKKLRLRLMLRLLRAVIDVLELDLDRQIERMHNETWMAKSSEAYNNHSGSSYDTLSTDSSSAFR